MTRGSTSVIKKNALSVAIRGAGGKGGGSGRTPVEAPDSLRSIAYAKVMDLHSEGECFGFPDPAHPLRDYFLNETVVENADGTLNFSNIAMEYRTGTQLQDPIRGFDAVENETLVGSELRYGTPYTHAFTNLNITAIRIRLSVSGLSKVDKKTGDIKGHQVGYKIELSTDGGSFVTKIQNAFTGKTTNEYERCHRIDLPTATDTGWIVRVTRITTNADSATTADTTNIKSYAELIDAKLRMPMSAYSAVIVDASQFNSIPSRAVRWKGRLLKVPSNYNPVTREYTGIWDGTFQVAYSNNPAWVFYDMALNNRYGLGHRIPAALVDKWVLYNIAVYCDGLVDDGKGGTEPRFTANVYLQQRAPALKVMQDLATIFRGIMYAQAGAVTAVADMPSDPVYTYTPANVIDGKFNYSGSGRKARHTVALVSWNDMTDFGRAKIEYVEDEDAILRYGIQPTEVIAIGCTSQGQARRLGRYILATERFETDTVSFGVGLDGTFVAPGSIVNIADPLRAGQRMGGRIKAYGHLLGDLSWYVEVDATDIAITAGDTLICILPNGTPESREISTVVGNLLQIDTPFTTAPIPHSVWAVTGVDLALQTFRILSVMEGDDLTYSLTGVQHVPGKFDFVELGLEIVEPNITGNTVLQPPDEVLVTAFERVQAALPILVVVGEWEPKADAEKYEVKWRRSNGSWSAPIVVNDSRVEIEAGVAGEYLLSVSSVSHRGYTSTPRLSALTTIQTPNFTLVTDIASVAGVLTIDCQVGEQFRVVVFENITSVVFLNVSSETTLILELRNTGNYTIVFPANVVPVSGVTYVMTIGGTVDTPKVDTVGLHTDNAGVLWYLRADVDDQPATGGGGGTFSVTVAPNPAYAYAASSPSRSVTATTTGGTAPITATWTRAAGGVGDWGGTDTNVGGGNFACSAPAALTTIFSRTGTANGYVAQNWLLKVVDAAGLTAQVIFEVALEDDGEVIGGGGTYRCPWAEAFLPDGRRAKDVKVGSQVLGVDPITLERKSLLVTHSKTVMEQCVEVECEDGSVLTCSRTAPMPVPGGGLIPAPDMLGLETITLMGLCGWEKVIRVTDVGLLPVQHITCENGIFFVGNIRGRYLGHHNIKWEPDGPGTGRDAFTGL